MPSYDSLFNAFVTLLVTIDPPGLAPLFLALTRGMTSSQRRQVGLRGSIIGFFILALFAVVGAGILRGTADTRSPAIIAFIGYWVLGLPVGLLLAFRFDRGPQGLWWGLTLGLASVAAMFVTRIRVRFRGQIRRAEEHGAGPL